ncbi:hypothetical protein Q6A51_24660 [Pseudomonas sp. KFB-139]|uniref:Uncharacterized protein n=1 Tax=Pseudomonas serbiensis TaxID=3064350 RepID=A0ABT9CXM1_9PSED|nr:hypothetical protein [Pseudomonas sp. KFB-138]MDO7929974.1 hypothetical protein [Pseudomonas sp. KFB-138]
MDVCFIQSEEQPHQSVRLALHASGIAVLMDFQHLAARQSALSMAQLSEQQANLLGPKGLFARFSQEIPQLGRQASVFEDLYEIKDRDHQLLVEKTVRFILGRYRRREVTQNPFTGMSREFLCCVVYDEAAPYTQAERYAAGEALRQRDSEYFAKLIATTRDTVERRIVFHGLLEHFDGLLPVEQSIYPLNYRAVQQSHLDHEEALYGNLDLTQPLSVIFETHTPEWLLENLCVLAGSSH